MSRIDQLAKKIWDYHHLNQPLQKADCIVVLGSHDIRVAEYGITLFQQGYAPYILFSGNLGRLTKDTWSRAEAEIFAEQAHRSGIPESNILIENQSTNTGENITLSLKLLKEQNIPNQTLLFVHKPYMERRTYATAKQLATDKEFIVTSPPISFEAYPNEIISKDEMINVMVGDLQRIKEYPARGFQISQEIPEDIWDAYLELIKMGYDKQIIQPAIKDQPSSNI